MLKENKKIYKYLNFARPKWNFYLVSQEAKQLYMYAFAYIVVVFPMFILTIGTEDYIFGIAAHLAWLFFLYLLVIRNGFIRGKCLNKISRIAIDGSHIMEFNFDDQVIRSVSYKNTKVVVRKRSAKYFDIEVGGAFNFTNLAKMKPFMPLDYGDDPCVYAACKISIEEIDFCRHELTR